MNDVGTTTATILNDAFQDFSDFLPQLLAGILLIIIGLIVASLVRAVVSNLLRIFRVDQWMEHAENIFNKAAPQSKEGKRIWPDILATLAKWTVFILFLLPAFDAMGLTRVTQVLNQLILYIPNIFVAVIVGFVGVGIARLVFDVVSSAAAGLGEGSARLLANVARYALLFFTGLIVLNQLGVAQNLVQILFTGIVAMLSIAGGLAFGLGGQEKARDLLNGLNQKVNEQRMKAPARR